MMKLGILDDHPAVLSGLKSVVNGQSDITLVLEANYTTDLFFYLEKNDLDVLVLDLNLSESSGFEVLKALKKNYANIGVLVLTSHEDETILRKVLKLGAMGFLSKDCSASEVLDGIYTVANAKPFLPKKFQNLINTFNKEASTNNLFSEREKTILMLICDGKTTKEIADELELSVNTVNSHRSRIFAKTDAKSIVGLIKFAYINGYMD